MASEKRGHGAFSSDASTAGVGAEDASRPSAPRAPGEDSERGDAPGSRLADVFRQGRPALITYIMAGYPDRATSLEALRAAARGGADLIELGVPYGDPLADGPVIAEAAAVACAGEGGFGLVHAIQVAEAFVRDPGVEHAPPVVAMTYMNPVMRLGLKETAERLRAAGIVGVIIPDMPPEAAGPWRQVSDGIETVFLTAPTSTDDRLAIVAAASSAFIYCVSAVGTTGERESLAAGLVDQVERVRQHTALPVAVGFGVSTAAHAAQVAAIADGVIVGSAIVKRQADPRQVETFVRELAAAVRC